MCGGTHGSRPTSVFVGQGPRALPGVRCVVGGRTEASAPTASLKYSSLSYSGNVFRIFVHFYASPSFVFSFRSTEASTTTTFVINFAK